MMKDIRLRIWKSADVKKGPKGDIYETTYTMQIPIEEIKREDNTFFVTTELFSIKNQNRFECRVFCVYDFNSDTCSVRRKCHIFCPQFPKDPCRLFFDEEKMYDKETYQTLLEDLSDFYDHQVEKTCQLRLKMNKDEFKNFLNSDDPESYVVII